MLVRVRKLTSRFDVASWRRVFRGMKPQSFADYPTTALSAAMVAPRHVDAKELELDVPGVRRLFASGELRPTDLILMDDSWQTLNDCIEFDDIAERYRQSARTWRRIKMAAVILVMLSMIFGVWVCSVRASMPPPYIR